LNQAVYLGGSWVSVEKWLEPESLPKSVNIFSFRNVENVLGVFYFYFMHVRKVFHSFVSGRLKWLGTFPNHFNVLRGHSNNTLHFFGTFMPPRVTFYFFNCLFLRLICLEMWKKQVRKCRIKPKIRCIAFKEDFLSTLPKISRIIWMSP